MQYNFNKIIDRKDTNSKKWSYLKEVFNSEEVLPMWVADMDFKVPVEVTDALRKRVDHEIFGYTGIPKSFYTSISNWVKKRHNWDIKEEWIVMTPGVVMGLNLSLLSFTEKGDKVIIQPPIYPPFFSLIKKNKRVIVENPLKMDNLKFKMNLQDLEEKIDKETKMMFLCNPHNPGGKVWDKEVLEKLGEISLEKDLLIISDEIHSDIIFKGYKHTPIASLSKELENNTITLMAPSKTFNIAGLSTSVAIIPNNNLRKKFKSTIELLGVGGVNLFGVIAFEAAYNYGEEWLEQLLVYLEENLNYIDDYLKNEIPKIKLIRPEGTFLAWLDCRDLGLSDDELREFMIYKAKVGLNHGITFGKQGSGFQRLNFGCPRSILEEGLSRIKKAVSTL